MSAFQGAASSSVFGQDSSKSGATKPPFFKNKKWIAGDRSKSPSPGPEATGGWQRGGFRGGRGRHEQVNGHSVAMEEAEASDTSVSAANGGVVVEEPPIKTWEELVKARELERTKAIKEGKMDDPSKAKRLDEAITIVGTCQDMCPEFERYRRERENNLDRWECIIGPDGKPTRKVDHSRAVKIYERGQGDKIIPSDLRPAPVLKRTLDYLFHELLPQGGFSETQAFIRDRSRAVRNDFTIEQDSGPVAIECHERCARYHILSLHLLYGSTNFDRALEVQQLMNSLLSLKEFYEDQRNVYQSPNELEMRIYHRLGLIRDQRDRNDSVPPHISEDPAFVLISRFRTEVQAASSPITKTSKLVVGDKAMQTFGELAAVLNERGNVVMIYLVACFLEHIFGTDTIDNIEAIRGNLTEQDIIDGISYHEVLNGEDEMEDEVQEQADQSLDDFLQGENDSAMAEYAEVDSTQADAAASTPSPLKPSATQWLSNNFAAAPTPPKPAMSVFGQLAAQASGSSAPGGQSVFSTLASTSQRTASKPASASPFGTSRNLFGGPVFGGSSAFGPKDSSFKASNEIHMLDSAPPSQEPPFKHALNPFPTATSFPSSASAPTFSHSPSLQLPASGSSLNPGAPAFTPSNSAPKLSNGLQSTDSPVTQTMPAPSPPVPVAATSFKSTPFKSDPNFPKLFNGSPIPTISPPVVARQPSLTIDTSPFSNLSKTTRKATTLESPVGPPPLKRMGLMSLPPTPVNSLPAYPKPTSETPIPSPLTAFPPFPTTPIAPPSPSKTQQKLSPPQLPFATPERLRQGPSPLPTLPQVPAVLPARFEPIKTSENLRQLATSFAQRGYIVRECFNLWKKKATDHAVWQEAYQRSVVYKQKVKTQGPTDSPESRKRKMSIDDKTSATRARRRSRRAAPESMNPRTDQDLALRLQENKETQAKRWAKGTFTTCLRKFIQQYHLQRHDWCQWLCLNADDDGTAIWLEQKFDVPNSGRWVSEAIFSVDVFPARQDKESYPGLIVFECTPLESVDDDLERRYRILDDCSRLRDVLSALPTHRHYIPSLLVLAWDTSRPSSSNDLTEMVSKAKADGTLLESSTLHLNHQTAQFEDEFTASLRGLDLDFDGRLAEYLPFDEYFSRFGAVWRTAVTRWISTCGAPDRFHWALYGHILTAFMKTLERVLPLLVEIWERRSTSSSTLVTVELPRFDDAQDSDAVYMAFHQWYQSLPSSSYNRRDRFPLMETDDFYTTKILDAVLDVSLERLSRLVSSVGTQAIPKTLLSESLSKVDGLIRASTNELKKIAKTLPRPTRRTVPESEVGGFSSFLASPSSSYSSPEHSRNTIPDLSLNADLPASPSPAPSVSSSAMDMPAPTVTASMLRDLARNVLKTYGKTSR